MQYSNLKLKKYFTEKSITHLNTFSKPVWRSLFNIWGLAGCSCCQGPYNSFVKKKKRCYRNWSSFLSLQLSDVTGIHVKSRHFYLCMAYQNVHIRSDVSDGRHCFLMSYNQLQPTKLWVLFSECRHTAFNILPDL